MTSNQAVTDNDTMLKELVRGMVSQGGEVGARRIIFAMHSGGHYHYSCTSEELALVRQFRNRKSADSDALVEFAFTAIATR